MSAHRPISKAEIVDWTRLDIAQLIALEQEGDATFVGQHNEDNGVGRIFGGQILAQTLSAAARTVAADRPVHSMQLTFCASGRPALPVRYTVHKLSDGATTSVRSVHAMQGAKTICVAAVSSQRPGAAFEHEEAVAGPVPDPASQPDAASLVEQHRSALAGHPLEFIAAKSAVEMRLVDARRHLSRPMIPGSQDRFQCWVRTPRRLPDDPVAHQCAVAYLTDYVLAHVPPLQVWPYTQTMRAPAASVNHALWFYRPMRADEWMLLEVSCPVAAAGRALATAKVYDTQEHIVAITTQECVYRATAA